MPHIFLKKQKKNQGNLEGMSAEHWLLVGQI